jgi:hypothetical protein
MQLPWRCIRRDDSLEAIEVVVFLDRVDPPLPKELLLL